MKNSAYVTKDNVVRYVFRRYGGVNNVAKKFTSGYVGVGNVARSIMKPYDIEFYVDGYSSQGTLNDSFAGEDGDTWRFYLNTTLNANLNTDLFAASVDIFGDFGGKTLKLTYKLSSYNQYNAGWIQCYDDDYENMLSETRLTSTSSTTKTITIPSSATIVSIWLCGGKSGTSSTTMTVTSLTIGGEEIIL